MPYGYGFHYLYIPSSFVPILCFWTPWVFWLWLVDLVLLWWQCNFAVFQSFLLKKQLVCSLVWSEHPSVWMKRQFKFQILWNIEISQGHICCNYGLHIFIIISCLMHLIPVPKCPLCLVCHLCLGDIGMIKLSYKWGQWVEHFAVSELGEIRITLKDSVNQR